LLRQYREAAGLSLEELAKQLRVSKAKLQALEQENWSELTDVVFIRSLALSICRFLKVDAAQVLEALPRQASASLKKLDGQGLNAMVQRPRMTPLMPGQNGRALSMLRSKGALKLVAAVLAVVLLYVAYGVVSPWLTNTSLMSASESQTKPQESITPVTSSVPAPTESVQPTPQGVMVITTVQPGVPLPLPEATASSASVGASESVNGR
jgi:cytoskeleton protein RodZ